MIDVIKINSLKQTSWGCPSQWIGDDAQGNPLFIDYREGILRVWRTPNFTDASPDFCIQYGRGSVLTYQELRALLRRAPRDNFKLKRRSRRESRRKRR